ncbi:MAG: AraC family transcriptional regulator [Spirochaetes bacterium]|nr:AraC family transcriptional regulator [Spirochaetota bacterium]
MVQAIEISVEQVFGDLSHGAFSLTGLYAGRESCRAGHTWEGSRNHFLFHYIRLGKGSVQLRGRTQLLGQGDGFLLFPGEKIRYRADEADPWAYSWAGFTGDGVAKALAKGGLTAETAVLRGMQGAGIERLVEEMIREGRDRHAGASLAFHSLALRVLAELVRHGETGHEARRPGGGGAEAVERVCRFIEHNYSRDISVGQIADASGFDRSHLSRLFRRLKGESLQDFLIVYRMERARELLGQSTYTTAEVCHSVGYRDVFAFAKRFKKSTGYTPAEYRRRFEGGPAGVSTGASCGV